MITKKTETSNISRLDLLQLSLATGGIFLMLGFATGFLSYFSEVRVLPIKPIVYLCGFGALMFPILLLRRPVASLSVGLLLVLLVFRILQVLVFGSEGSHSEEKLLSLFFTAVVYFSAMSALAAEPRALRFVALYGSVSVVALCTLVNLWEWSSPGYFSTVEGRSAGWLVNANASGIAIGSCMGVFIVASGRPGLNAAVIFVSAIGIYLTLSRGGMLGWFAAITAYFTIGARTGFRKALVGLAYLAVLAYGILSKVDLHRENAGENIALRESTLLGQAGIQVRDESRYYLMLENWKAALKRPFVGYGAGASMGQFQPHNQFLGLWLDQGLLGLALFLAAIGCLCWECWCSKRLLMAGVIPIVAACFFSHNLLDDRSVLFAWAALGGLAAAARAQRSQALRERQRTSKVESGGGREMGDGLAMPKHAA